MSDILFDLLDRRIAYYIKQDLDNVDEFLNDLDKLIRSHKTTVKLTKNKVHKLTNDEITAIKDKLDSAFNLTWGCQTADNAVIFGVLFKDVKLDVHYYFKSNRSWSNTYAISGYLDLDKGDDTEVLLIDKEHLQSIDEVINYISTFFLRLRDSVNYLEVNHANSIIHSTEA